MSKNNNNQMKWIERVTLTAKQTEVDNNKNFQKKEKGEKKGKKEREREKERKREKMKPK